MHKRSHPPTRRYALRLLIATPLIGLAVAHKANANIAEARALLSDGRGVVYFRHGATTWSGIDSIDWPREQQRLLSDLGIAQSERIGAAFREQGLPVGEVIASPFARCRDFAEIAFGRVEERSELLGLLSDSQGRADRVAFLRNKLAEPTTGGNRIIVSHRSNIAEVAGVSLGEGDAAIVRPTGDGWETLAQMTPADWDS
ncbi:MAG: histidine phosphatase family protein [Pseudomonadota bacterium]